MRTKFQKWLISEDACNASLKWLGDKTPQQCYESIHRSDWLIWWLRRSGQVDKKQYQKLSIKIALTVVDLAKNPRVKELLEQLPNLIDNNQVNEIKSIRSELNSIWRNVAAYVAADAAAYAADYAAYVAAVAADAAAYAADYAAYVAADAAAYAADYAAYVAAADAYAAADAARSKKHIEIVFLIKQEIKFDVDAFAKSIGYE